ncbi:UDP-N-acetylmuramoyl-L-alanyl-D-glutamate--2,6-diaminopimelate ligase [Acidocella sp.]|uniref:UDP-N-acetylmuramoyl-L-alanyl-D-glutamate--2, 6-diaminopimelate ligase n=1 Tax=Acidocella sp. TaxID=50710 RepID=UPI0026199809|nr:UDP-N-acetylmuramoyl-L-alanyl-D-glutamate--2,6-diaminopimelate ligase [Acidocella sp.]
MDEAEMRGVLGLTADSRAVRPGWLFAALPGARADGRAYIGEAVARGAVAVLAPEGTPWPPGVPPRRLITARDPRARLAELAVAFFGRPPERLAAVTGTNGKTSTADFLRQMLGMAGREAASIGTLGVVAPGVAPGGGLTTPDPVSLARVLAGLAQAGVSDVALEASSHGLDQHRLDGLRFAAAGFTNLTRDHLDYHGSMAAYGAAKLRLFEALLKPGAAIRAMADLDPELLARLRELAAARRLDFAPVAVERVEPRPEGQVAHIGGRAVELPLPGRFQAENAALAASLAEALGVGDALALLPRLAGVRGRLERALVLPNGAAAYVDYAHTPDAIARLLAALRPHASNRLHIVLGAGGDRDAGKRPLMGAAAARGADVVIVTDDNPRGEDPALIRQAILAACPGAVEIGDRRAAIAAALEGLRPGDVLVVAGKGHEQGQIIGGEVIPFDDAAVIRELGGGA